uniref:AB hydrolase-1 domain-containing protein n=1 Tax=Clastoptera arizonana TaxID=38151 RepID=A0A1B6DXS9_9HEMI
MEKMEMTEISIPVPWGIIAGFVIGDPLKPPVLCVHGFQDNSNSFLQLLPLLSKSFYYICIDLPSHGKSCHFPDGMLMLHMIFIFSLKRVVDYFKFEKIHYMGHSFGGVLGILFSCIFPEHVEKLIVIDTFFPTVASTDHTAKMLKYLIFKLFEIETKRLSQSPLYSMNEILEKMLQTRKTQLTPKLAEQMILRSCIQVEDNKFQISNDLRLKLKVPLILTSKQAEFVLDRLVCSILILDSSEKTEKDLKEPYQKYLMKKKNVVLKIVEGDHDMHMVFPERLAPIINSFLIIHNSRL